MKKILLVLLITPLFGIANDADLFKVDQKKVDTYMQDIKEIEILAQQNNNDYNTTYDLNPNLFEKVNLNTSLAPIIAYSDTPLGIPSFVWGLCCGVSGLAVVYFITEDSDETKKALYGCLASGVISVTLYVAGVGASLAQ